MTALTATEIGSILLIVLWNGFFVAAEYAFVTVRRTRLHELIAQGSKRAASVLRIVENPTHFISAMQLAVTLSSLALGAVGEPAISRALEGAFGVEGKANTGLAGLLAVIIAFVLITTLHVVLGEIVPKTIGLGRAEATALWVAGPVRVFFRVFLPFIWVLQRLARIVNRSLGLEDPHGMALVHSEDELKMLVSASHEEGVLEAEEQEMLYKVFDFSETEVEDVMVPRPDVVALSVTLTPAQAMEAVLKQPYTRYPVYRGDLDDICGMLHLRSLYDALAKGTSDLGDIQPLLRPAHIVPETKKLGKLLTEFQRTSTHMAVVVDEYGSTAGIVTLEDLIEQIIGEIDDEYDRPDVSILRLGKDRIRIAGSFPIEDFNERFGLALSEDDYVTIGGFIFGELGRAPGPGDSVDVPGCRFRVHEVDGARILTLDAHFKPSAHTAREDDEHEAASRAAAPLDAASAHEDAAAAEADVDHESRM
jgi:CBS domain containing-hemolysin-like protein